jgi:guanylate kinase
MNELKDFQEFRNILEHYEPSASAKDMLKGLKLVALVAPTSAGRNTIIRSLIKTDRYHFIISDTTRPPRINDGELEKDGSIYWFRTEEEVLQDLREGKFLEAEIIHKQQVSGISIRELIKAKGEHRVAITDLDIGGIKNVLAAKEDTIAILVLPPNFDEWQRRITSRGKMSKEELIRRLQTAKVIFAKALNSQKLIFLINDDLKKTTQQIDDIVSTGRIDQNAQDRALALLVDLNRETGNFLETNT